MNCNRIGNSWRFSALQSDIFRNRNQLKARHRHFKSAEECENTKFGHRVMDLETKAKTLKDYCQQWTRLTLEQQNRKLIMALAERIGS